MACFEENAEHLQLAPVPRHLSVPKVPVDPKRPYDPKPEIELQKQKVYVGPIKHLVPPPEQVARYKVFHWVVHIPRIHAQKIAGLTSHASFEEALWHVPRFYHHNCVDVFSELFCGAFVGERADDVLQIGNKPSNTKIHRYVLLNLFRFPLIFSTVPSAFGFVRFLRPIFAHFDRFMYILRLFLTYFGPFLPLFALAEMQRGPFEFLVAFIMGI